MSEPTDHGTPVPHESTGPEAPEPLDHVTVAAPSFAAVAAEDTEEALEHEHEAVDRVEQAAAQQVAAIHEPAPAADDQGVLPDEVAAEEHHELTPAEDLRQDAASMLWGMPVPGLGHRNEP